MYEGEKVEVLASNKGGAKIIHQGYMYTVHKQKNGRIRWRCSRRSLHCKGSITTKNGVPVLKLAHNHVPDMHAVAIARNRCPPINDCPPGDVIAMLTEPRQRSPPFITAKAVYAEQESDPPSSQSKSLLKTRPRFSPPVEDPLTPESEMCLRWNSHHANMQTVFPLLMDTERYVDVSLAVEGKVLKCHKLILSSCSDYFDEMLKNTSPLQQTVIYMRGIQFWQMKALVDFMYKGEVNIDQRRLESLLKAAEDLQIKGLAGKSSKKDLDSSDLSVPDSELPEQEIQDLKSESPVMQEDDGDEEYFPNPEYKRKYQTKKTRKRKIFTRPDPSLLKHVKINLKGTKSRPNIKQPKFFSPDFPEYDPDRCVSPPKLEADQMIHIDNIKLEPIDVEMPQSPNFFEETPSLENEESDPKEEPPKKAPKETKTRVYGRQSKTNVESEEHKVGNINMSPQLVVDPGLNGEKTLLEPLPQPSTSKTPDVDPLEKIILKRSPNKKAIILKCQNIQNIINDETNIQKIINAATNKQILEDKKGAIRIRNIPSTTPILKKFSTTQLTSILKKGDAFGHSQIILKKVGTKPSILRHATPPIKQKKSDNKEVTTVECKDEITEKNQKPDIKTPN